jgi:hypothetical protein
MIENDAALHRCVGDFIRRVQELLAVGHTRDFIVQALQGAVEWVSPSGLAARMARETPTFSFPQEPTMFEVSRVDAAVDQLDWAIRLFLDHKAYVAAVTLAGAAEELLGKPLAGKSAHQQLHRQFMARYGAQLSDDERINLNETRNLLKHWDGDPELVRLVDLEDAAIQYIMRGLMNLFSHDTSRPIEYDRFVEWLDSRL